MNKHCFGKMHYFLLVIMLSFVYSSITAQVSYTMSKWRYSDPKPLGFTVLDVKFYDNNFGIAVGGNGGIARTFNGGAKWEYGTFTFTAPSGLTTNGAFSDISVPSSTVAYVVGSNGMMAKTTDAAQNWSFVRTPLYANSRSINTCWFFDSNNGYIAGQWNTPDSIPKIYRTRDGGATWDSLAAPLSNGTTKVGYVQNTTYPGIDWSITAKAKEIYRMQFLNPNLGYIVGSGSSLFPGLGIPNITNSTTCAVTASQLTTGSHNAPLVWKFDNGVLVDYSVSKERLGYTGYTAAPPFNCASKFGTVSQVNQLFRAFSIVNDSTIVMLSFNNNVVIKVRTGKNDSTLNVNRPGVYEKGKYEMLNTGPSGAPFGYPAIPPTAQQTLFSSNPYRLRTASNGKLYAAAGNGSMWTSVDTGRTWKQERSLPAGKNYSSFATWAFDFLPNGKLITMGQGGVIADSIPGGSFQSNYELVGSNGNKVDFVDCSNGIVAGGSQIAVTTTGGNSWIAKHRQDFANSFYNINGFDYTRLNKCYFAVSNGVIYSSPDQATTLDPLFSDFNFQMNAVQGFGTDTVYAVGYSQFSVPTANRKSSFFRTTNAGATWQTVDIVANVVTPAFTAPTLSKMAFPSRNIGYAAGSRNGVYKTTNGGTTWTSINPFPALNENVGGAYTSYTAIFALDDNTVYVLGNIFTTAGFKRLYKTTDGGATWTDISNNINTLLPVGNMLNVIFHDQNNGYVVGSNVIFTTTNGGTSWSMEVAPHGNLNNAIGFSPRTVTPTTPFANRKVFIAGLAFASGIPTIMEYGDTLNVNINSTETITGSCSNGATGSIVVNASGGLAPYSYSINGGAFQSSNTFNNLTSGVKTIVIKDAYCGIITKQATVGIKVSPGANAGPDKLIVSGDEVTLDGSGIINPASIAWTPATSITSGANTYTPSAKPTATTNYTVTVTDPNGCVATDNTLVTVLPYCIKPMDAFTPNGDGINDKWLATTNSGSCTSQVIVNVFNRYGNLVYSNENYQNDWNGTYKGKPVPDGTYYYVIKYKLVTGNGLQLKGDVTILR